MAKKRRLPPGKGWRLRNPARHWRAFLRSAQQRLTDFPDPADGLPGYWHNKIGIHRGLLVPPLVTPDIMRLCAQSLIDEAAHWAALKPPQHAKARVMAILSFPDLFDAETCIFWNESAYQDFLCVDGEEETWSSISSGRDLRQELGLQWPDHFKVRGYRVWRAADLESGLPDYHGELWLIGELD